MSIVKVHNVSKIFRRASDRKLLSDHLRGFFSSRTTSGFHALRNVSFTVAEGESVALIGANGAGKSTLLALICGLAEPDEGCVEVNGSIATLLELASGFHPDLTGRENLLLNAALLGLSRRSALRRYQEIVDFAGVADFMDQPLRTYSNGMMLRLGFSVAVHCDPALVVIDEVLAVGDAAFQAKCHDKILDFRRSGKTLLFVSHSAPAIKDLCDRAIWLHHGELVLDGPAADTVDTYGEFAAHPGSPLPSVPGSRPLPASP